GTKRGAGGKQMADWEEGGSLSGSPPPRVRAFTPGGARPPAVRRPALGRLAGCTQRARMADLCDLRPGGATSAETVWQRSRALGRVQFDGYVGGLAKCVVHGMV